ncbi:MAG: GNAT family N-acetyltransferase [Filomicrobium sp.]
MTDCTIAWDQTPLEEWFALFAKIRRSTLSQYFPYAQAARQIDQLGARRGLISLDGVPCGLVQIGEVGLLGNAIHMLTVDRGPLWFDGVDQHSASDAFFREFARQFPRRFGRKKRVIPELDERIGAQHMLTASGLSRNEEVVGYETIWLNLEANEQVIRAGLAGKWRNSLSKAERSPLSVEVDWELASHAAFLRHYEADRKEKNYSGVSLAFLECLMGFQSARNEALIVNAQLDGKTVAAILVFLHGKAATYQVGWTLPDGRQHSAHHLLLWEAIRQLKQRGIADFDLGGINDESAAGVKKFKMGLGGEVVKLVGLYN